MKSTSPKSKKIRMTPRHPQPMARISRAGALERIAGLLKESPDQPEALDLIELFNIDAEELAETGVPYETLKALERSHPLLGLRR